MTCILGKTYRKSIFNILPRRNFNDEIVVIVQSVLSFFIEGQTNCGESMYEDAGIAGGSNPSSFIVGGWQARPNEFPWQVI